MKRTGASQTETALHFGLTNPPMIASWNKKFLEGGAEALDNPKGRPAMSDKAKNVKKSKKPAQQDEMTREQKLEQRKRTSSFGGRVFKKVKSFSDGSGRLSRKAQAALSFELKENFQLKNVLQIVGIPESTYHYHIKGMKTGEP